MFMSKFNVMPNVGGFLDQSVNFVQFSLIAMSCESEVNRTSIKRSKFKNK
jgi:hypothetical protein